MLCMGMRRERGVVGYGQLYKHQAGVNLIYFDGASGKEDIKEFLISPKIRL
jgi:hypothetical protein